MEFMVNGKVKSLNIYDKNGINWSADLIGNCVNFSKMPKDEDSDMLIMSEDDFNMWEQYISDYKVDEETIDSLKAEFNISAEDMNEWLFSIMLDGIDMEYHHREKQKLFDKIRAEYAECEKDENHASALRN